MARTLDSLFNLPNGGNFDAAQRLPTGFFRSVHARAAPIATLTGAFLALCALRRARRNTRMHCA